MRLVGLRSELCGTTFLFYLKTLGEWPRNAEGRSEIGGALD